MLNISICTLVLVERAEYQLNSSMRLLDFYQPHLCTTSCWKLASTCLVISLEIWVRSYSDNGISANSRPMSLTIPNRL